MATITRSDLASMLRSELGFKHSDARELVDCFFSETAKALEGGESVRLSGFGVFSLRRKHERLGRNPRTGKNVMIDPRTVVRFHTGNKLRSRINERQSKKRSRDLDLLAE